MLLSTRLWLGEKIYGCHQFGIRVSPKTIIKECTKPEVEALEYLAENTKLPLPKIIKKHKSEDKIYLEMKCVRGKNLHDLWIKDKLSNAQKSSVIDEVIGYVNELRELKPPKEGFVGSAFGNACFDLTVKEWSMFGPFEDHDSFHEFRRCFAPIEQCTAGFNEAVTNTHTNKYRSVFTHGNLMPANIFVDNKMSVVAIVGWDSAGWFPEYWDFVKAHHPLIGISDWFELWDSKMPQYSEELEAEKCLKNRLNVGFF